MWQQYFCNSPLEVPRIHIKLPPPVDTVLVQLKSDYEPDIDPDGSLVVRIVQTVYGVKKAATDTSILIRQYHLGMSGMDTTQYRYLYLCASS